MCILTIFDFITNGKSLKLFYKNQWIKHGNHNSATYNLKIVPRGSFSTYMSYFPGHSAEMLTSDRETYLGDLLTTDNKIDQNIIARCNKGMGKINGIISLLQEVSFGPHYFKMAILFRSSMLLSSMLCNSEVLYGITKSHIKKNLNKLTGYSSKDCSRCLTVLQLKPSILKHQLFISDIFL